MKTEFRILGGGIAGQVLHHELFLRGVGSVVEDIRSFPRPKVCGGVLQGDSWEYLRSAFSLRVEAKKIFTLTHFWGKKRLAEMRLRHPMMYVPRWTLDAELNAGRENAEVPEAVSIDATGAPPGGDWIGFESSAAAVSGLEMHYGRGMYLGITPTGEGDAHAACLVLKNRIGSPERLRGRIADEFGVELLGPLKGTGRIDYRGGVSAALAVGDAKMTTHPILGLGMKHAIESSKLLAALIQEGRLGDYPKAHARLFKRFRFASRFIDAIYDTPLRCLLRPFFRYPALFFGVYDWLHGPFRTNENR